MRAMFELQMDDCLLRGDSSRLISLLHYEGLSTSTLTRLHHLVTKELRSSGFSKVLVVLKSVSILSENKDDLQTLVNLGLTAKVMLWFEAVHDLLTSDLQKGSTSLLSLTEEFFDYFLRKRRVREETSERRQQQDDADDAAGSPQVRRD